VTEGLGPIGQIGDYNLLEQLEPAGPGDLYRARDTRRGRTVTIRLMPVTFAASAEERAQLFEQVRGLSILSHPNITTIYEIGEHDGRVFIVFEYLKGQSLRAEMAGRQLNLRTAIEIAVQVADATAAAHAAGFAHGGLSPDSVVVTAKGRAKIPAYELAVRTGFDESSSEIRLQNYESPEEEHGPSSDERSDVYSVGSLLYEMLTAKRPNPRGSAAPSAENAHVPKDLDSLVLHAVAPKPEWRIQTASELAAQLRRSLASLETATLEGDMVPQGRARQGGGILIALAVLAVLAGLAWWAL
jgi:serine/threonine protein kinase